ncbi:uncharacterized protein LOC141679423 [Apium graveolens]|uniref:uncharacterized protein LOC141679423 n=1 Tax=Apium graveolens TaxID=4045 RepID=UPI003D7B5C56
MRAEQYVRIGEEEGIVEEENDEEESPEQAAARLKKGKWAREETTTTIDLPNGITRTVIMTSERLENPVRVHHPDLEETEGLTITEVGETSEAREDLDPRIPPMVERAGTAEDTIPILVDLNDPSKSSDKCHEFFKAIKGVGKNFEWTEKCEEAFQNIKKHLSSPSIFSNPKAGETLVLYLAVSDFAVSAVLVREEDGVQLPVYDVSKRLADAETRYANLEKLTYALILASQKLRPYFQAHKTEVRTSYPLRQVMHKPEASGRMLKWTIELGQSEVDYKPRTAIKVQTLADFILEFPPHQEEDQWALIVIPGVEESEQGQQNCAPWFNEVRLELIPRGWSEGADELAKLGSRHEATLLGVVPLDIQRHPSVPEHEPHGSSHIPHEPLALCYVGNRSNWRNPKGKGGVKYAVVAVDYFTKWAEAEPLATITLVSDNGKQFDSKEMWEFCEQLRIHKSFSAVCHPQSNGQTKAVNKIIKHTLKAKLEEKKGTWPEELTQALWSYNTTPRMKLGRPLSLWYMGVRPWCRLK